MVDKLFQKVVNKENGDPFLYIFDAPMYTTNNLAWSLSTIAKLCVDVFGWSTQGATLLEPCSHIN